MIGGADRLRKGDLLQTIERGPDVRLLLREKVIAPGDRRPERLLARIGVATPLQEVETLGDAFEDLRRRERSCAGGGELDCEGEVVEARTKLRDLIGGVELRAFAEERNGFRRCERRHGVLDLALHAQELAARYQKREVGTGSNEGREVGCGREHLLKVLE